MVGVAPEIRKGFSVGDGFRSDLLHFCATLEMDREWETWSLHFKYTFKCRVLFRREIGGVGWCLNDARCLWIRLPREVKDKAWTIH